MEINMTYQDATRISNALQQLADENYPVNIDVVLQVRRWRNDIKSVIAERDEIIAAAQEQHAERKPDETLAYEPSGAVRYKDVLAFNRELNQALNREAPVTLRGFAPALCTLLDRNPADNDPIIRNGAEFVAMFGEDVKAGLILEMGPLLAD